MEMKINLEQLRAKNALQAAGSIGTGVNGGRAVAKKVPAMIIENGFIGAMAFAIEDGDKSGYQSVFKAVITHLQSTPSVKMMHGIQANELNKFLEELCRKDASTLRAVTTEAMAYLNYLRRFAKPKKDREND